MSVKYHDLSAATQRFRSHLTAVASRHALVPVSVLAAVSIAGVAGGLIPSIPRERVPARTVMAEPADVALSSPEAARAAHDRWQAARRVCDEMQERGGPDALPSYSICMRKTLAEDSML